MMHMTRGLPNGLCLPNYLNGGHWLPQDYSRTHLLTKIEPETRKQAPTLHSSIYALYHLICFTFFTVKTAAMRRQGLENV